MGGWWTYEPQCNYADDVHEDVASFTKDDGVEGHEWLRRAEGHESVVVGLIMSVWGCWIIVAWKWGTNCTEEEQNDSC